MIYLNVFLIAFIAFAISMVCGGGAGLLLIPILGHVLPASQVPAALSVGTSVSSLTKLYLFFQHINWRIVRHFLPLALLGVIVGAWLLSYLAPMYIELCMAIFLVCNLPYLFKKTTAPSADKPALSNHFLKFIGFLAGFISALTGAVGVLFNGVYLRYGLSKEEIIATRAANEIFLHIVKLGLYAYFGLFTLKALTIGILVAIAAVAATYLMKYVLPKISISLFSKIGYGAMVLSGVVLLNSAIIRIQEAHDPNVHIVRVSKGYDATLNWDDLIYTIEFKYGEGFEFERIIPFTALDAPRQAHVNEQNIGADKIVIEKVYSLKKISYEAYYYKGETNLIKKIKFK
ncbi:sulfite exporter TauE/SafE family protein [Methylophilus glucosoxydans]|uniref:Probable membrane transporter protein n=1 Tax=Methylophilus glucosoxydans TaxID=752553 RepID=A0ABW3GDM7_9PROT